MHEDTLRVIKENNKDDVDKCFTDMISTWLKQTPRKSWFAIIKALKEPTINLVCLGNEVEQQLGKHQPCQKEVMATSTEGK